MRRNWQKIVLGVLLFCTFFSTNSLAAVQLKPSPNTVTLSFDDGPNPIDTPRILAILRHYHIRAVFFVVSHYARLYPYLVREIIADGHVVGDHSITHPMLTQISDARLAKEIGGSQQVVANILGYKPVCFRPPFLATSRRVRAAIHNFGMNEIMGAGTEDYRHIGVARVVRNALREARSGTIIIFHDGPAKRGQTVAALPQVIEGIQRRGLGFSVICESNSTNQQTASR